ncbi:MAG: NAD-dependent epimerase/dehydratase family protein [Acidobacteria bacterium]|nr:NAD-dependent epimerase/dehydratase family protein [Acidobacteriota bacterium]
MEINFKSTSNKLLVDGLISVVAFLLAFQIRYDGQVPPFDRWQMWTLVLPIALGRVATSVALGMHRRKWRYLTTGDSLHLAASYAVFSLVLLMLRLSLPKDSLLRLPIGVIAAELLVSVAGTAAARLLWKTFCDQWRTKGSVEPRRMLLVGAGFHGSTLASEMARHRGIRVVGFLDDDPRKQGSVIAGARVLGPTKMLSAIVKREEIDDVLICIPPAERNRLALKPLMSEPSVRVKFMPTLDEVLESSWSSTATMRSPVLNVMTSRSVLTPEYAVPTSISNKRILITGGAGFIGSSLASRLVAGNELVLFDLSFSDKPIQFTSLLSQRNVQVVEGDILDDSVLSEACRNVDIAIHTAALLGVSRVCKAARNTLETNYVGTSRLLAALETNTRLQRLVYFSTSEVFGVNSYKVTEDTPTSIGPAAESRWSYAIAKLAGEHLVKSYYRDTSMPAVIVRPFNVFGPRRTADYALSRFIMNATAGEPLEIHGDGSQIRAWCYIDDFCDAIIAMLERPEAIGEDFNIGNPANTTTIYELARKVVDLSGSTSPIVFVENPHPDISIRVPCLIKAQRLLTYNPQRDLDSSLRVTIDWHRQNWNYLCELMNWSTRSEAKIKRAAVS